MKETKKQLENGALVELYYIHARQALTLRMVVVGFSMAARSAAGF